MANKTNKRTAFSEEIIGALAAYSQGQHFTTLTKEAANPILPPLHKRLQKPKDSLKLLRPRQAFQALTYLKKHL